MSTAESSSANTGARRIRVLVVDDHPLFRHGVMQMLDADKRFEVVGEAGDGMEAFALIRSLCPEVVVLDVNMPRMSGLELVAKLRSEAFTTKVLILSMNKDEATFNKAMDAGAHGYLLKENAVQEILEGTCAVAKGAYFVTPSLSGFLLQRRQRSDTLTRQNPGLDALTKAEKRILKLIAEKKTSREIADEFGISPRTVETHRSNICDKLHLTGSHSLLQFALEHRSALGV